MGESLAVSRVLGLDKTRDCAILEMQRKLDRKTGKPPARAGRKAKGLEDQVAWLPKAT